ncbi:MAG: Multiple EGF-like-domain protein 3 precursor [Myxococcales bacterium]|nr:Multiple EGF-like-domain protein 3 precursor [Myxococcales bacterium]
MTTRLSLLGGFLIAALAAACGGDDGGEVNATCGDSTREGAEQCDDGNTASGDGCSSACTTEIAMTCGDSSTTGTEQCDDGNTTDGDGCSAMCQTETPTEDCGNGMLDGSEGCDDGDITAGDGCSAACAVETGYTCVGEPSVCTMTVTPADGTCAAPYELMFTSSASMLVATGTGDTTNGTSQLAMGSCNGDPDAGAGKDHVWKFTTTATSDVSIEVADTSGFDTVVRLLAAPCDLNTEIDEYLGADGCSDIAASGEVLEYTALPAGTYYVVIDGYLAADAGMYSFTVTSRATLCGNGMIDPISGIMGTFDEPCDDGDLMSGDGCSNRCDVEPGFSCDAGEPSVCVASCGDGVLDAGEECDDDNTTNGDRCSATCTLESDVVEAAEPNNTVPLVLSAGSHIIRGELTAGDVDLYTFTLTAATTVHLETYNSIDLQDDYTGFGTLPLVDCDTDTLVSLYAMGADVTSDTAALFSDDDDGDSRCSYLGPNDTADDNVPNDIANPLEGVLQPGTYTIRVNHFLATGTAAYYILDLKLPTVASTAMPPAVGDLVINEYMAADGPASSLADTNCDGNFTGTDDEFVELVNVSQKTLDLAGVTIHDGSLIGLRHTFPAGATVAPGKAVVVWGGGAPACPGVTNFFTATETSLGLNDDGDTISVRSADLIPVTLATRTYATAATTGVSDNLSPDVTGTAYALHTMVTGAVGSFSPGKHVAGTAF